MKKLSSTAAILAALVSTACFHVKAVTPLEPAITADSSKIWVHVVTDDASVSGIYRCSDLGEGDKEEMHCKKVHLEP